LLPDGTYGWVDAGHDLSRPEFPDVAPPAGARPRVLDAEPRPPRKGRRWLIAVAVVVVLVAGAAGAAFGIPEVGVALGLRPSPRELATRAATGFLADWQAGNFAGMQSRVADTRDDMNRVYGGMAQRLKITKVVAAPGALDATGTAMPYNATVSLQGLGDITWSSTVNLVKQTDDEWKVKFTAGTVYPGMNNGQRLELAQTPGERGKVVDRNDRPLADDPDLSVNVLGTVKDGAGATGLERAFNAQLAGRASTRLQIVDVALKQAVRVLQEWGERAGESVKTTFDLDMQQAADRALTGSKSKAALVAIDTQTGEVRAMASYPTSGLAAAFSSYYAPGSTSKIITATAALMNGLTPESKTQCPTTLNVNGRTFKNAEKAPNSSPSLLDAFAESCNTAFINIGRSLPSGALQRAAELYGFNSNEPPLPISSVGGRIPAPVGATETAADAIGQGKVEASPLQMASVAAGVASGTWRQPHLVADCPTCKSNPIPVASSLQPLMRAVVTSGTGTAVKNVPGGPVYGKTGTAEFGSGDPPQTHAWFVGWRGTTAFAVFVEEGEFGGTVAAPIAAQFLRTIG
jgi:cell division protein FtsI/penicillin-binding protein 2